MQSLRHKTVVGNVIFGRDEEFSKRRLDWQEVNCLSGVKLFRILHCQQKEWTSLDVWGHQYLQQDERPLVKAVLGEAASAAATRNTKRWRIDFAGVHGIVIFDKKHSSTARIASPDT